ncbi:MAG: exodeoxyribonuclease VII small subunit [bacterium]|nr:exodeoxyribonuclease VII small subunit [bacterium]
MPKTSPNFSAAFQELEELTEWFEREDVDLDEGIKKFERGLKLAQICKKKLAEVEHKVTELKAEFQQITDDES